jgi:hypothetical protein
MATSGSADFSMTRNQIIGAALRKINALGNTETLDNSDLELCSLELNMLMKHFENQANHVWKRSEAFLFLQTGQVEYNIYKTSTDHATESYVKTALAADVLSGATSITVDSATGLNVDDYIGIVLDDDTLHWSQIATIVGTTVTIDDVLTDDAATDNIVYAYTTKLAKPIDIIQVRRRDTSTEDEVEITDLPYLTYQRLPNKTTSPSTVIQFARNKTSNSMDLFVWPSPANVDYILSMTITKPIEDFDSASDTPDVPQEWYLALVYQLALILAPTYGRLGSDAMKQLIFDADKKLNEALKFDNDVGYIKLKPRIK